jgi:D-glycero-D-manno-heptose 1,7-bisphosphate phosphatase
MAKPVRLVVLDRDGVINEDSDAYIKSPEEWIPLPGSLEAIGTLCDAGYTVAVATNQSGVARGYYSASVLESIHDKMLSSVAAAGGHIDFIAVCPHGPDDGCLCRKPRAGLLEQIAAHYDTGLDGVPVVGDSLRDLEAAAAVGATPVLVLTGNGEKTARALPEMLKSAATYPNLAHAADALAGTD